MTVTRPQTPHTYQKLGHATVDFIDGNAAWRDSGELELRDDGLYVLYLFDAAGREDGSRVFPLKGRTAEVYIGDSEEALIIEGGC